MSHDDDERRSPARATVLLLMVTGAAAAQSGATQSGSPVMAIGQGLSVDPATAVAGMTATSVIPVESDFKATPPVPPPPVPGAPDFAALPFPPGLDVDALSLGFDWVLADAAGTVDVPPGHWGAITFSVRRSTAGVSGSVIAAEAAGSGGAAADVFAYVLPGSALPSPPVGVTIRALDSQEIAVDVPGAPANVDAHDAYIGLVYRDNPQLAALLPPPTVFFSVTAATTASIPGAWTAVPALRSGATVFATTWDPANSAWTPPIVAFAPAALGLDPIEDLDALALDLQHGRALLSTDPALPPPPPLFPRSPLLFSSLGSGTNGPYLLPGGLPVATAVGLGAAPDDIDAICALDPGTLAQPSQIRLERMLGSPGAPAFPGFPTQLQASVYRHRAGGQERLQSFLAGWPTPGTPAPGIAVCAWSTSGAAGPWTISGVFVRPDPASPYVNFTGHPLRHEVTIPPQFTLSGVPVTFVWVAFDAVSFDFSAPATIVL